MRIAFLYREKQRFNGESLNQASLAPIVRALIQLARELAQRGHEIYVFCQCDELAGSFEGVHYCQLRDLLKVTRQGPLDVLVSVADENALKLGIKAQITLWWSDQDFADLADEKPDLRAELAALLATRADRLMASGQEQAQGLSRIFGLPAEHVWYPAAQDWPGMAAEWEALLSQDFVSTRQQQAPLISPFPTPVISVIIPTYNRARNLAFCLESLTWQDEKAFEVIICDDGSSDNTREVAQSFKDRLNLSYRYQEDLGFRAAEARNLGLQAARGKLLIFLDSDIVVPPAFVRTHAATHARYGLAKIAVNSFVWRMLEEIEDDLGLPPAEYIPRHQDILKPDSRTRYQLFERSDPVEETYFLDSNAFSIKREDLELVGGFDPEFVGWGHEDTELGYRIARYGFRLALVREGAEAYHIYHYAAETKDAERAVNWKLLTQKHGIDKWYHPLWELSVSAQVLLEDSDGLLPVFQQAEWELKVGHPAPLSGHYYHLQVEEGILTGIKALGSEQGIV